MASRLCTPSVTCKTENSEFEGQEQLNVKVVFAIRLGQIFKGAGGVFVWCFILREEVKSTDLCRW